MIFYCEAEGQLPAAPVDWSALYAEADALPEGDERDTARAALDSQRIAEPSHLVRNGGLLRVGEPGAHVAVPADSSLASLPCDPDPRGGVRIAMLDDDRPLLCPECLAPVRLILE